MPRSPRTKYDTVHLMKRVVCAGAGKISKQIYDNEKIGTFGFGTILDYLGVLADQFHMRCVRILKSSLIALIDTKKPMQYFFSFLQF